MARFTDLDENKRISSYTMWPFWVLITAGIYNIVWGLVAICFPDLYFSQFNLMIPVYPIIWQFIGFFFSIYGIGYLIASLNPVRFWPFIFIGLLVKICIFLTFAFTVFFDFSIINFWVLVLFNSIIWIFPFGLILRLVYLLKITRENFNIPSFEESLHVFKTNHGQSLFEISQKKKVLVVFLRHFGCVFCRQLLYMIQTNLICFQDHNVVPVLVYMSDHKVASKLLESYDLSDCDCISDQDRELYRSFGLSRGKLYQLFGLRVWWKTFLVGVLKGYGVGNQVGDAFQMSGMFLLEKDQVIKSFIPEYISDKIDLQSFIQSLDTSE